MPGRPLDAPRFLVDDLRALRWWQAPGMTTTPSNVFRVGDVLVEPEANSIANSDGCVRIEPLLMDLLVFLARRPGRVVRREEIFDGVWQQRYVARSALTRAMALLRQALGDDANQPRFVETIPKRGYRLIAPVEGLEPVAPASPSGGISLLIGDCELPLSEGEHVIGRSDDAEVRIPAARISRRHARIVVRDGHAYLEDLGSKNGTSLRGRPVMSAVELSDRDVITIGATVLVVRVADADAPTETATGRANN